MKKKLLVFCPTLLAANAFFLQHDVFRELARSHDIYLCCNTGGPNNVNSGLFRNMGFKGIFEHTWSARRRHIWALQLHINTLGGRSLSRTCRVVYYTCGSGYGNILERCLHRIFGASYAISRIANHIFERYAGIDENVKKIIEEVRPDLIITFLTGPMPLEIEATKIGKLKKVPVMGIQYGWEHVLARGRMPHRPDYMGVWGYQSMVYAERVQAMAPERIFHIGTTFQDYLNAPAYGNTAAGARQRLGIPPDKKIVFFVGGGAGYNEVRTLKALDKAIEEGVLGDSHVLYRPHPYQHRARNDLNYFEQDFKHISLDPAMERLYRDAVANNRNFPKDNKGVPIDFAHLKDELSVASIMVLTASTLMINGALLGIPSVSLVYADRKNKKYTESFKIEEFSLIRSMPGVFFCLNADELVPACVRAINFNKETQKVNAMKCHAAAAIYDDGMGFHARLKSAIESVVDADGNSLFHFLNRPVLDKIEELVVCE